MYLHDLFHYGVLGVIHNSEAEEGMHCCNMLVANKRNGFGGMIECKLSCDVQGTVPGTIILPSKEWLSPKCQSMTGLTV